MIIMLKNKLPFEKKRMINDFSRRFLRSILQN